MSIGKFVMTKGQYWSGLTTRNHLGQIYATRPMIASKITGVLLAKAGMKNLDTVLNMFPVKYLEDEGDFYWKMVGSHERNIPLIEARYEGAVVTDATNNVGANRTEVELVFSEKYFSDVHVIAGSKPDVYQYRVLKDPQPEGPNGPYVYTCEVWGGPETYQGVPGSELLNGERFSIEGSPVERTMSIKGSDINFSTPYTIKNTMSQIRVETTVPGNMINCKLNATDVFYAEIESLDDGGKVRTSKTWMQEIYWRFEQHLSRLKAFNIMFGKSNRDENGNFLNIGKSGFSIESGSGIREQMEVSNVVTYNIFSLRILEDMLHELSEGKLDFKDRVFILRTGERGAKQFSQAINREGQAWKELTQNNPAVVQKTTSPLHSNAFKAGYQFTEFEFANSIKVMLEVDPMYDDRVRNKVMHPDGGVAESYRYDILYIGSMEEPNIQKVMVKDNEEIRGYQAGFRNPFTGERGSGNMGRMEDSATITAYCMQGAMVKDPSRTASLIPSVIYQG